MMRIETVVALFPDLAPDELTGWIERHWVVPETDVGSGAETVWIFTEIDVARVRLIYDLSRDLEIADETMPMMLSLLDQLYELRCTVKAMNRAIATQPDEVQRAIFEAMDRN